MPGTALGTSGTAMNKIKCTIFMDILAQVLAYCGPQTKSGSMRCFCKIVLKHSHTQFFPYCL